MFRKFVLACIAVAALALAVPTNASARYYGYHGWHGGYHGWRGGYRWGYRPYRYYGVYPYRRYYGVYGGYYGCWRSVLTPFGYWRRVWVCG